ncbi:hypothetical protein [Pedobacter jamesrossensis]|uniref:hypothetical protein n=1 Tax=Pedobacter jamesrossensis TaxID=1908238 RepID=UPI00362259D6
MNKAEVEKLLEKYRDGLCTGQEKGLGRILASFATIGEKSELEHHDIIEAKNKIWQSIEEQTELRRTYNYKLWFKVAAAAIVLFFIGFIIIINSKRIFENKL